VERLLAGTTVGLRGETTMAAKLRERSQPKQTPEPHAIPWLLVTVTQRRGNGALSWVSTVQRVHTEGGAAPVTGCSDSELGIEMKVPYAADYYFYAPVTR
jgi:hypothetical protein